MLLGFILLDLPYNPKGDTIAWVGVTRSLFFQWLVFSGILVRLWRVLRITVTVEFSRELKKCIMGLADRRAHVSKCCFVCSVV